VVLVGWGANEINSLFSKKVMFTVTLCLSRDDSYSLSISFALLSPKGQRGKVPGGCLLSERLVEV
jgi:hypothetical protein